MKHIKEKYEGQSIIQTNERCFVISDPKMEKITAKKFSQIIKQDDYFITRTWNYIYEFIKYAGNC